MAPLIGALPLLLANVLSIAIAVSLPVSGWSLRLGHHLFDALEILAVAAWLALPAAVAGYLGAALSRRGRRSTRLTALAWLAYGGLASAGMYSIVGIHLARQARVLLNGAIYAGVYPFYVVACGAAVPAAHLVGAYFGRLGRWRAVPLTIGVTGVVVNLVILRDDYPGVHAALSWVAICLLGAAVAPDVVARLAARPQRRRQLLLVATLVGALGVVWAPSNAVRVELFRQPGAAAPWVLAQLCWRAPEVRATAEAPRWEAQDPGRLAAATHGLSAAPVVVVITVDALRADVVADRRHDAQLPTLAWLRDHGAWFARASSAGSQTSVSLTSAFSSRYFSQLRWGYHGIGRTRFLYAAADDSPRFPALLSEAGVATHSVLGVIFLASEFGITRGFADEKLVVRGRGHAEAANVLGPILKGLSEVRREPALFYAHVMEPHEPYDRGAVKTGPEWERYLSEVEVVDRWLARILDALRRRRLRGRGYLIVSADHGEAFGEHGTRFHTKTLYQEMIAVPLLMWGPRIVAGRIDERVSLVDLGPTLLNLYRKAIPDSYVGRSLLPLARGQGGALPRPVLAEGRLRRALYEGNLKAIEDPVRKVVEVYDLDRDPGELDNLFDREPERAHPLVAKLRAFFAENTLRDGDYEPPYKP